MAVSQYFNHISHPGEQKLAEDILIEAIQQRGVDVHYVVRERVDEIEMFNEADRNNFNDARLIEMYIESISNFNGEGDIFSKFGGFTLDDTATFMVSAKRFKEEVPELSEPRPGDLIYLDFADQLFEIQKKLQDEEYRQLGQNKVFRLQLTKFKYGHEDFSTGVEDLDDIADFDIPDIDEPTITSTNDPRDTREEVKSAPEQNNILEFGE